MSKSRPRNLFPFQNVPPPPPPFSSSFSSRPSKDSDPESRTGGGEERKKERKTVFARGNSFFLRSLGEGSWRSTEKSSDVD